MNIDDFVGEVAKAKAALKALDSNVDIPVKLDSAAAMAGLTGLKKQLGETGNKLADFATWTRDAALAQDGFASALYRTNTVLSDQTDRIALLNPAITSMTRRLGTATARQAGLQAATAAATQAIEDQTTALAANAAIRAIRGTGTAAPATAAAGGGGGWWGLAGTVPLFGGLATLPLWHVLLDGIIESAIALGAALIAMGAAAAAMAPAALDIYNHLTAVNEVTRALGQSIPALGSSFQQLQKAVAPQTIEAYGGYLDLMSAKSGGLENSIHQVVIGFDDWIARLDIWAGKQGGLGSLINTGAGFLRQFAGVADSLGVSISRLVKADPGTAHYLMDLIGGAAKLIEAFTSLPAPIVKTVLALHSLYLWGGLLVTLAIRIGTAWFTMGTRIWAGLAFLAVNPTVAIGGGILAGLAYFVIQATRLTGQAQAELGKINAALASDSASAAMTAIPVWIQALSSALPGAWKKAEDATRSYETSANKAKNAFLSSLGFGGGNIGDIWAAITNGVDAAKKFFPSQVAASQATNSAEAYQGAIVRLTKDQNTLYQATGNLVRQGYTYSQSLALMDMAGVQAGDHLDLINQKVKNLIGGYKSLSIAGSLLMNSANAITFATEQQESKVSAITQGYSAFISLVTGGQSAFSAFQQQITGIATAAGNAAATITVANGKVSVSTKAAGTAAVVSMNALTTAGLQLQNSFGSGVTNASNLMNQLYTLASAAGMGQRGVGLLTQAGKDMVAQLLPMAHGSKLATAEVYALAQTAGYQGADSFKQLALWMGNVKNPAKSLDSIVTTLTVHAAGLAQDVANLSNAINPQLNNAMAAAILQAGGGQKAFDNFATAFVNGRGKAGQMATAAQGLARELVTVLGNTAQAKTEFEAMATMMGISQSAADRLWTDMQSHSASAAGHVISDINRIKAALDGIPLDKTINLRVLQSISGTASQYGPLAGGYRLPPPNIHGPARGYAAGSAGASSGWAWVGEAGPELVRFRGGETVIPSHVAQGYAAGTGDSVHEIHVHLDGREIFRGVQTRAVNRQRRTGSNGLEKRSR